MAKVAEQAGGAVGVRLPLHGLCAKVVAILAAVLAHAASGAHHLGHTPLARCIARKISSNECLWAWHILGFISEANDTVSQEACHASSSL